MKLKNLAAAAAVALAAVVVLNTVVPTSSQATTSTTTYTFAGDSITQYSNSWLRQMSDPELHRVGGYAMHGYTTGQVLDQIAPAPDADVLVIMLGTNDIRAGLSYTEMTSNIEAIAEKTQAKHVLLSLVAPNDYTNLHGINRKARGIIANREYQALAVKHGWLVADPFAFCRASDNSWGGGCSDDGTHPNTATGAAIAARMSVYIRQAAVAGWVSPGAAL